MLLPGTSVDGAAGAGVGSGRVHLHGAKFGPRGQAGTRAVATFLDPLSWALLLLPGTLWHQSVMAVKSRPAALLCSLSTKFGGIKDKNRLGPGII